MMELKFWFHFFPNHFGRPCVVRLFKLMILIFFLSQVSKRLSNPFEIVWKSFSLVFFAVSIFVLICSHFLCSVGDVFLDFNYFLVMGKHRKLNWLVTVHIVRFPTFSITSLQKLLSFHLEPSIASSHFMFTF